MEMMWLAMVKAVVWLPLQTLCDEILKIVHT